MIYNYVYVAPIHNKWKPGVCDTVKGRFKTYNKGNFNFKPTTLYVVEEGYEEQCSILETKVITELYEYLENPNFYIDPTEYVNPDFPQIDDIVIDELISIIICEHNLRFRKVKEEFLTESISDGNFLEKIRLFPDKYTTEAG